MMLTRKAFIGVLATVVIWTWQTDAQAQIVEEGLVHYWTFNDGHIRNRLVEDAVGENNGKMFGEPTIVEGAIGQALKFDGVDDYISLTPVGVLSNHSFTLQAWLNVTQPGFLAAVAQGDAWERRHYFAFGAHNRVGKGGKEEDTLTMMFRFYFDDKDGGHLEVNEWYHLMGVYDKDAEKSTLYVNGEDVGGGGGGRGGLQAGLADSAFEIGANYGSVKRGDWFHGIIDEVGIYDRVLNAEEVKRNYNAEKGLLVNVPAAGTLSLIWGQLKAKSQ